MLGYIKTFLPWIAFAVLATNGESRYGAIAALVIALALLVLDRRAGKQWDALIIALTISPAPLGDYSPAVAGGWLALTAWGSLAIRKPFTLGIARTMVPAEMHSHPFFYRTNAIITAAWAIAFTAEAVLLVVLLHAAPHATAAAITVKICSFVVPAVFTVRYSQAVRARRATA
jgi:hypothetical protein